MANTIRIKRSGTASNTPSVLEHGELALNYADGKLFYKDANNVIQQLNLPGATGPVGPTGAVGATGPVGPTGPSGPTGPASEALKLDALTFNGVTTTFALLSGATAVYPASAAALIISLNGVVQEPVTDYTVSGNNITFSQAPASDAAFFGVSLNGIAAPITAASITSGTLDPARLPLATTGAAGAIIVGTGLGVSSGTASVAYGTSSGTACQGNDSRLSDARTPTSHTHGNISNAGAIGSTADQFVVTTTSGVLTAVSAAAARTALSVQPTASPTFTGSVGINVTPTQKLHVHEGSGADVYARITNTDSGSSTGLLLGLNGNEEGVIRVEVNKPLYIDTNNTTRLTISSTGTATFAGQIVGQAGAAITGAATFENSGNVVPVTITNTGTANSFVVNDASSDTDPFVIDASGNVAVGLTSTTYKLDINGNLSRVGFAGLAAYLALGREATDLHNCLIGNETGAFVVYGGVFGGTSTERLRISSSGTATFAGQVVVTAGSVSACSVAQNGDPNTGLYFPAANVAAVVTDGVERVRVTALGRVGIGTTNPAQTLHVSGGESYLTNTNFSLANGTGTVVTTYTGASTGNTFGAIGALTGGGSAWGDLVLQSGGGRVGIGTTTPGSRLEVIHNGGQGINCLNNGGAGTVNYAVMGQAAGAALVNTGVYVNTYNATNNYGIRIVNPPAGANNYAIYSDAGAQCYFGGNIGIGTTTISTGFMLDVRGAALFYRTAGDGLVTAQGLQTQSGGTGKSAIQLDVNGQGGFAWQCDATSSKILRLINNNGYGAGESTLMTVSSSGTITASQVYSDTVGATNRDLYVDSTGKLGYVSSIRQSKTDIVTLEDVSWLSALSPVSYRYRKKNADGTYSDEADGVTDYGLIAEDVETVRPELCFYDVVDGEPQLRGVTYSKLIAPMLKYIQQLESRIAALEERLNHA
jgi:hypothetical protein